MAATEAGEVHQRLGPKPAEATTDEDVRTTRADPSTATLGAPSLYVPTTSTQQAEEEDVILVTGPST